jgi:magnesium chelatase family protein
MVGSQEYSRVSNRCPGFYFGYPHPCGYFSDPKHECRCTFQQIHRYRAKISGPLMDRIDIHVEVPAVPYKDLRGGSPSESSERIAMRVAGARAYNRILKISRTMADLDEVADIQAPHVAEAIQYRTLDRGRRLV